MKNVLLFGSREPQPFPPSFTFFLYSFTAFFLSSAPASFLSSYTFYAVFSFSCPSFPSPPQLPSPSSLPTLPSRSPPSCFPLLLLSCLPKPASSSSLLFSSQPSLPFFLPLYYFSYFFPSTLQLTLPHCTHYLLLLRQGFLFSTTSYELCPCVFLHLPTSTCYFAFPPLFFCFPSRPNLLHPIHTYINPVSRTLYSHSLSLIYPFIVIPFLPLF